MGRKMWLLVGLMVLVFGSICCAGKEENQKNSFREREQSVGFAESFSLPAYAESPYENAIYFLPTTARDQNILYWDLEQNAAVPLCGKAECAHDTKECNAWTGNPRMDVVQVIEDKLYVMDRGDYSHASSATGIYRMDLDGSNREELCQIHVPGGSPQNGIIYKEYFYCRGIAGTTSQGFSKENLYRQKLEPDSSMELIFESEIETEWERCDLDSFHAMDGKLYYETRYVSPEKQKYQLYCYDTESGENQMLYENEEGAGFICVDGIWLASCGAALEKGIYKINLEDGTKTKVIDSLGRLSYDGKYLYVISQNAVDVYDLEWKLLDHFEASFAAEMDFPQSSTTQSYIIFSQDWMEEADGKRVHYHEYIIYGKDEIGKEEKEYDTLIFEDVIQDYGV